MAYKITYFKEDFKQSGPNSKNPGTTFSIITLGLLPSHLENIPENKDSIVYATCFASTLGDFLKTLEVNVDIAETSFTRRDGTDGTNRNLTCIALEERW